MSEPAHSSAPLVEYHSAGSNPLSFATLRPWRGSQDRAFEELSYQLLKDEAPEGSAPIRTGNPDGGVEWYADLPNGDQWGWQAKNISNIDALLSAMTESARAVAIERPALVRLTFVISVNLTTGTAGRQRKSQRQKYEDKVATWKRDIPGADRIDFELVQESDLLNKLVLPEHRGRAWFWWNQPVFGEAWLESLHEQQASVAGDKYRPDLQVDLPIENDLRGLGLAPLLTSEFSSLREAMLNALSNTGSVHSDDQEIELDWDNTVVVAQDIRQLLQDQALLSRAVEHFDYLRLSLNSLIDLLFDLETKCFRKRDVRGSSSEPAASRHELVKTLDTVIYRCRSLRGPASSLRDWIEEPAAYAAQTRLYFLAGPAGSGKTHLLLDGVREALDELRPAVVLHGDQFRGELWSSICAQLGLPSLGKDVLLGAMDAAAEAASANDQRFVIMIDAINETPEAQYWETYLPVLRSAIPSYSNISLAVSCRDTYIEAIDPNSERIRFTQAIHPGFAGQDIEATQKYFNHYGLVAPRIPLLTPEFTIPLFLRLYCESLYEAGSLTNTTGHEGRIAIFERYLTTKIDSIARRVFPGDVSTLSRNRNQSKVRQSLNALLDGMAEAGSEWLPISEATALVAARLDIDHDAATAILGGIELEGIVSQEPLYLHQLGDEIGLRITFQAFSDFLLLKRRLDRIGSPLSDAEFKTWLGQQASWGILEAATIMIPEIHELELPDFLGLKQEDFVWPDSGAAADYRRANRARHIMSSFATMLPYRSSSAITKRTIELLNEILKSDKLHVDGFSILYMIAPHPDNYLNAQGLHDHLSRQSMPARDSSFGIAVYNEIWNETSPITRLARWAASGPYPSYPEEVIELSATALSWLLSSPNRYMRDWVTKALVQLLHGHLDIMATLIERFWSVNDPYIVQRIVAIAYGCLMRGGHNDRQGAQRVAQEVLKRVFARPIRADELLLDAGRGVVEWATTFGVLPVDALAATKRPYGLIRPGSPPTLENLKAKYYEPYDTDRPHDESYQTVWSSLFGMADFGRYVVDSDIGFFSRYRVGQDIPKQEQVEPRLIKNRWNRFIESLSDEQRSEWEWLATVEADQASRFARVFLDPDSPHQLTDEQNELLNSSWTKPRPPRDDRFPSEFARRWIFQRMLSIGWVPRLFGERDWIIARMDQGGRSEHKAERWGKKYQWIAFHELLARVADNYQTTSYLGEREPYEGLHQLTAQREIDPSLPPIDYRSLHENRGDSSITWRPSPVRIVGTLTPRLQFHRYHSSIEEFIDDSATEPTAGSMASVLDVSSSEWIPIHCLETQSEDHNRPQVPSLEQITILRGAFLPECLAREGIEQLAAAWNERSYDFDSHGHIDCCYAGEIGWSPRSCPHHIYGPRNLGHRVETIELIDAVEGYTWEGNILDCSIGSAVLAQMPCTYLQSRMEMSFSADGPSWVDHAGNVVAVYQRSSAGPWSSAFWEVLYVRSDWVRKFLASEGLALCLITRCERRLRDEDRTYSHRHVDIWTGAAIRAEGAQIVAQDLMRVEGPNIRKSGQG